MAMAAGAHLVSSSSSAFSKLPAALPPHSFRLLSPCTFQPLSSCTQDNRHPLRHQLRHHRLHKYPSSLFCGKHEGALIATHMAGSAVHFLSSSASCPLSNVDQSICKGSLKRSSMFTASAAADSDQPQSSHEELGEGLVGCCEGEEQVYPKKPSPEIKPGDVVQAQLRALCEQDFLTVFEFASPKSKAHTGPLSQFTEMIQGRAYNVMLGHASAKVLSTLSVGPERFQQRILIEGANGKQAIFSWSLSRQESEPFQDCWMTDSVHRDE